MRAPLQSQIATPAMSHHHSTMVLPSCLMIAGQMPQACRKDEGDFSPRFFPLFPWGESPQCSASRGRRLRSGSPVHCPGTACHLPAPRWPFCRISLPRPLRSGAVLWSRKALICPACRGRFAPISLISVSHSDHHSPRHAALSRAQRPLPCRAASAWRSSAASWAAPCASARACLSCAVSSAACTSEAAPSASN
jgi:hypothetical protein